MERSATYGISASVSVILTRFRNDGRRRPPPGRQAIAGRQLSVSPSSFNCRMRRLTTGFASPKAAAISAAVVSSRRPIRRRAAVVQDVSIKPGQPGRRHQPKPRHPGDHLGAGFRAGLLRDTIDAVFGFTGFGSGAESRERLIALSRRIWKPCGTKASRRRWPACEASAGGAAWHENASPSSGSAWPPAARAKPARSTGSSGGS